MSIESQFEREMDLIDRQYEAGEISAAEHTQAVNELERDYHDAARDAAQEAYEDELRRWGW